MSLFLSQKLIPPARFPNPANSRNLPWGDHATVFLCDCPNRNVGRPVRPSWRLAMAGTFPAMTANADDCCLDLPAFGFGIQATSRTGPPFWVLSSSGTDSTSLPKRDSRKSCEEP